LILDDEERNPMNGQKLIGKFDENPWKFGCDKNVAENFSNKNHWFGI
jgi:hypothetical protein